MIASVTGATGFIGGALVDRLLRRGDRVRVLTRDPERARRWKGAVTVCAADLSGDSGDLGAFVDDADVVFHLAGELRDPAAMHALHVDGTRALAKAAAHRARLWVQLSSVGVYGPVRTGSVAEDRPPAPLGDYEVTKAHAERIAREAAESGAFACAVVRPSIVFGPGMPGRFLFDLVSMTARGLFFFIGPSGASANFVHVDNVAEALIACATTPAAAGRTYNVNDFRTMEQFVAAIAAPLGRLTPRLRVPEAPVRALARVLGPVPGFPLTVSRVDALTTRVRYVTERIETELGFRHRVNAEQGLAELVERWRSGRR